MPRIETEKLRLKNASIASCIGEADSELVADVQEPVAFIEVRAVRHQHQLRDVDAGAAAVLRVRIRGEAGAIGRLHEDSTEPIARIATATRRSGQASWAAFSYQACGTNWTNGTNGTNSTPETGQTEFVGFVLMIIAGGLLCVLGIMCLWPQEVSRDGVWTRQDQWNRQDQWPNIQ